MANYFISDEAQEDIISIYDYTLENWSESQAESYYNLIFDKILYIIQNPEIGNFSTYILPDIRKVSVKSHYIFYRVLNNRDVEILRILHQNMDLEQQFNA